MKHLRLFCLLLTVFSFTQNVHAQLIEETPEDPPQARSSSADPSIELERMDAYFSLFYTGEDFSDVKTSGNYGFGYMLIPWHIKDGLYAGIHYSLAYNFGLVDKDFTFAEIRLGPVLAYYFTPTIFTTMPIDLLLQRRSGGKFFSSEYTKWGISITPSINLGSHKIGVVAGPSFTTSFSKGSKVLAGFRAGIYFSF